MSSTTGGSVAPNLTVQSETGAWLLAPGDHTADEKSTQKPADDTGSWDTLPKTYIVVDTPWNQVAWVCPMWLRHVVRVPELVSI